LEFTLHKDQGEFSGSTVLVIGGIQGDEPGGFNAASLLVTHYRVQRGALWVVPNLNFESIIRRSRGVHGDMNRKFPAADPKDPDFARVEKIKAIITHPRVDYVFNLHDGSGFFNPRKIDRNRNPNRWGQSIIIDQEELPGVRFGALGAFARDVSKAVNKYLPERSHHYHVKNTRTREGNREMAKTLTYFAINNRKPAVGIEASKSFRTHDRVYHHLRVLEAYMAKLGLSFQREFDLTAQSVKRAVDENVKVSLYDDRIYLDMANVRRRLNFVPLQKRREVEFRASSPLVAIMDAGKTYRVRYGNRTVTELRPQRFDYDDSLSSVPVRVEGATRSVRFGTMVEVAQEFVVEPVAGYRVNVIGWRRKGVSNEAGHSIVRRDISTRFSVDTKGRVFRVEVYRGKRFCGMVLVRFTDRPRSELLSLKQWLH